MAGEGEHWKVPSPTAPYSILKNGEKQQVRAAQDLDV